MKWEIIRGLRHLFNMATSNPPAPVQVCRVLYSTEVEKGVLDRNPREHEATWSHIMAINGGFLSHRGLALVSSSYFFVGLSLKNKPTSHLGIPKLAMESPKKMSIPMGFHGGFPSKAHPMCGRNPVIILGSFHCGWLAAIHDPPFMHSDTLHDHPQWM